MDQEVKFCSKIEIVSPGIWDSPVTKERERRTGSETDCHCQPASSAAIRVVVVHVAANHALIKGITAIHVDRERCELDRDSR